MDVNWPELLNDVQDLRAALETWGITYEVLICIGISALALFLISLREIAVWYLRISQMQDQLLKMSRQLSEIQSSVDKVKTAPVFVETEKEKEEPPSKSSSFFFCF
jgi:hypothetical protein